MNYTVKKGTYSGEIIIPSSKSDAQRAIIIAALADGTSTLSNIGQSDDVQAVLKAVAALGAKVKESNTSEVQIIGISEIRESKTVHLGESGLGMRLMASVAAIFSGEITLTGQGSLVTRPMDFFDETLPQFGVTVKSNNGLIPISVKGPLKGNSAQLDGSLSSQFLSGLLVALTLAKEDSTLYVKDLKSIPYVQMTLDSLSKFGISIDVEEFKTFRIKGGQKPKAGSYSIEGDWSSASYWIVAAAIGLDISISNLNPNSLQADKALLDILLAANCSHTFKDGALQVDGKKRQAFETDLTHCPDLFPAVAVLASLTAGKSILKGTDRLTHKESNRALTILEEFTKLGCQIILHENEMHITGVSKINGGIVSSHHDHRIAMSLAILSLFSENTVQIEGSHAVAKSYPEFWEHLNSLFRA